MRKSAVVTGGSHGVGKGIVEGLAEAGYRIYFTGRDVDALAQTAAAAAALGGEAEPRCVDHTEDQQVEQLFAEIDDRGDHPSLLVNNVWGGYENMMEGDRFTWPDPFWEQPLWRWDAMFTIGVRAAYVAAQFATRRMLGRPGGLIINISFWSAQKHISNALYGMSKAATDKMSADMAVELTEEDISVISLYPGLVTTEKILQVGDMLDLSNAESPLFLGRVVAALHAHPEVARSLTGRVCIAAELAKTFNVTDADGRSPKPLGLDDA